MSKIENSGQGLKYKTLIIIVSIVIPVVVLILFNIRITSLPQLTFLPPIYASINGLTAILLLSALYSVKNKKIKQHELLMKVSISLSLVFLVMYILYHMTTDATSIWRGRIYKICILFYFNNPYNTIHLYCSYGTYHLCKSYL